MSPAGVIVLQQHDRRGGPHEPQFSNAHLRNNLFLGTNASGGIAHLGGPTPYSTYDYDGFRPNPGVDAQYLWSGARVGGAPPPPPAGGRGRGAPPQPFRTLAEFAAATGQETHGLEVDYDIFQDLHPPATPDSSKVGRPYEAADLDFSLKPGSRAVDAGVPIPNVNDGFTGRAPDLGAYEVGLPIPAYGPRGRAGDRPFYW